MKQLKMFNSKFYFMILKILFVMFVIILVFQFDISLGRMKYQNSRLEKKLVEEKTENRFRIDQVSQVAQNIANQYPAVGQAINEVLVDLKENNMFEINQKIADLPQEMQEFIIKQNKDTHGLHKYQMFDEDYIFPININTGYVPAKYGEFGWRPKVFDEKTYQYVYQESIKNGVWVLHPANDIASPEDPKILASNKGVVKQVGTDKSGSNYVIIYHYEKGKNIRRTRYFHLSQIYVTEGQEVEKGDNIGLIGNTGFSTSSHLHFEVQEWDGKKWININAFIGTSHNRKWMRGFYWYTNKEGFWKVHILD